MGRLVGYARISVLERSFEPQIEDLRKAGVSEELLFSDEAIVVRDTWRGLQDCLDELQAGDTLIVWRLDRIGKSLSQLVNFVEDLQNREIGFKSLRDTVIDTTQSDGEVVSDVFSCLAQFGRRLLQERARVGVATGRARGRQGGRRPIFASDPRVRAAKAMSLDENITVNEICTALKISRATYYRFLALADE
ncbi:recombinase family protein [Desulfoferrobacter suflitae]|uniref:recombinase family protein n=1 Tax=Desulfoferrobacter suflitae TaxID=2865782 RepID=UPI0021645F8F|nr:recombinase family protein [Desulfoferrobacter suflitae]MCK8604258.1 recombinase family protein [Desulfoferrobacter suflitae]